MSILSGASLRPQYIFLIEFILKMMKIQSDIPSSLSRYFLSNYYQYYISSSASTSTNLYSFIHIKTNTNTNIAILTNATNMDTHDLRKLVKGRFGAGVRTIYNYIHVYIVIRIYYDAHYTL